VHQISWRQRIYRQVVHMWTLRRVDRIVVNSSNTLRELERFMPRCVSKAVVLPLPVDYLKAVRPRSSQSAASEILRLLSFGHARNKGVGRLLRVLAVRPDACLTVICSPPTWQSLWQDEAEALGVDDRVRVVGGLSDQALVREYLSTDVFCMLSTYEGYGLPVAEALSLAVPTVISDVPVLSGTAHGYAVVANGDGTATAVRAIEEALCMPVEHWATAQREMQSWTWTEWTSSMLKDVG
jgi:glycosyltransferase involved in cell wall biosynthesis